MALPDRTPRSLSIKQSLAAEVLCYTEIRMVTTVDVPSQMSGEVWGHTGLKKRTLTEVMLILCFRASQYKSNENTNLMQHCAGFVCDKENFAFTTGGFYELLVFGVEREFDGEPATVRCQ